MSSVILATAGYDQSIRFWEASTGTCYRTMKYPDKQVNCLKISPQKKYIAAAGNPHIKLYDLNSKSNEPLMQYEGHTGNVTCIGFQKDGKWLYSGSEDGTVKIWDLRAAGCQRDYECKSAVNSVVLHPNQGDLITGDQSGQIRVWDLTKNAYSNEMTPGGNVPLRCLSVAADARLVVACNNKGYCYMWNPKSSEDYEPLPSFRAHTSHVLGCVISPDVKLLATASSDRTVKLWNIADWSLKTTLVGHQRWVWDCVFSADSSYLVTASSDTTARLWELSSGEVVQMYSGHHKAVVTVALSDSSV